MSWYIDVSRLVHLPRRKLRGIPNLLESNMHIGTYVYASFFNLFVYANVSAISVVRGDGHVRRSAELRRVIDVSGINNVSGDIDM